MSHLAQCQEKCFQLSAILTWEARRVRMLSFRPDFDSSSFHELLPPSAAEKVQTLSCVTASGHQALQSASSYRNNSSLEINKKLLHGHVAFMLHDKSPGQLDG